MKDFKKFIEKVEAAGSDYTEEDWKKADEKFETFTGDRYEKFSSELTIDEQIEMKPLTERLKPFLAYSASFYANGSHRFKFDTTFVTTMAIFNLEHSDKTLRYGDSMSKVKKEAKKEIKKIFGSNYKHNCISGRTVHIARISSRIRKFVFVIAAKNLFNFFLSFLLHFGH